MPQLPKLPKLPQLPKLFQQAAGHSNLIGLISIEIKNKKYLGIGGNLFAFACKISYENDYDGVIAFHAKTKLIEYYSVTLGAVLVTNNRMVIPERNAIFLLSKYYKDEKY